jgi:hypothetical protein
MPGTRLQDFHGVPRVSKDNNLASMAMIKSA